MIKSRATKKKDIIRGWHLIDAKDEVLGRLSSRIVRLLTGKQKSYYVPYLDCGDCVVVINAAKIDVTGNKRKGKIYVRYSGYPGGLKKETFEQLWKRRPEEIIRKAVWGMMPKTKLGRGMMKKLYIYSGTEHPHKGQIKKVKS